MGATLPPGPDPMTAPTTPPPRRPLATFLRASVDAPPRDPMPPEEAASVTHDALPDAWDAPVPDAAEPVSVFDPPPEERDVRDRAMAALLPRSATASTATAADDSAYADQSDTVPASGSAAEDAIDHADATDAAAAADAPVSAARSSGAPSFMRLPAARLHTPRWQWGVLAGLVLLLVVQIAVADRARLAADAGNRPWIAGLCRVLGCTLPAWQEPAAIRMLSRDVRPLPGQPGALQVQASFRNDARWAQAWPALRLSLSDADGRVIGTGVFAPHQYLDRSVDVNSVLEPGQSAQIAFRVREPAASTVAFTFEFQ